MSEHTPGPWRACAYSSIVGLPIVAQPDKSRDQVVICGVRGSREEAEANGELIARAPAMDAALRKIIAGPLTIAAPADIVSAVQDYHELVCEIAKAAIAHLPKSVPSVAQSLDRGASSKKPSPPQTC